MSDWSATRIVLTGALKPQRMNGGRYTISKWLLEMDMIKQIYQQVDDAVRRGLYLGVEMVQYFHKMKPRCLIVRGIEKGMVVVGKYAFPPLMLTPEEWESKVDEFGLWVKVDVGEYIRSDDVALAEKRICYEDPSYAGFLLFEAKEDRKRLMERFGVKDMRDLDGHANAE